MNIANARNKAGDLLTINTDNIILIRTIKGQNSHSVLFTDGTKEEFETKEVRNIYQAMRADAITA